MGRELSISELALRFGASEMTIRRDLSKLQQRGQVLRTHGGVVPADRMMFEFDFAARQRENLAAKRAIAREALKLINPPCRIILDTGTTALQLAYELQSFNDISVITPSLAVASALQFAEGVQTVLLGGIIRKGSPDLTGALTESMLEMFAADIAFQGADGIDADGFYTIETCESLVTRRSASEHNTSTYWQTNSNRTAGQAWIHSAGRRADNRQQG